MKSILHSLAHLRMGLLATILLLTVSVALMGARMNGEQAGLLAVLMLALVVSVLLLARETGDLRLRERALEASEGLLAATVRAAHDGVIVHDAEGRILEFNEAAERLTGHARQAALGRDFAGLLLPEAIRPLYAETVLQAANAAAGQRVELDICRADQTMFPADIGVGATEGANGRIFALHMRDITRQREESDALRAALEGAEEASRAKARFLAMMSHEIRTPLNGVLGALGLLSATGLDSEQKLYAMTATRSGEALLSLISDILDMSKMEAGKLELDASDFAFAQLMEDVRGILDPAARRHANSLSLRIDPAIPEFVTGDLGRLRQVLLNFGSNAVKFTTKGRVEITARKAGGCDARPEIEFAVTDTGIGIPRARLGELFKDFSMIDDSYRRRVGGTGLGLAISRRLIGMMGGKLGVESVEGVGSRFWFTVPLAAAASAGEEAPAAPAEGDAITPLKILLVEDNPTNLMVASRMLAADGHKVVTACDGCEAVETLRGDYFDVVLMDISMPEMDGMEATRLIRALPQPFASVPVIAMTAHAIREDRQRFLAAGMDGYLTKPVRRAQLQAALAGVAARKPAALAAPAPAAGPSPLVHAGDLAALEADMTSELLPGVVAQFVDEMLLRQQEAEAAANGKAAEAFRKAVHAVAGSASTVGARKLAELARSLEAQCLSGQGEAALAASQDFSRLLGETAQALRDMLPQMQEKAALKAS